MFVTSSFIFCMPSSHSDSYLLANDLQSQFFWYYSSYSCSNLELLGRILELLVFFYSSYILFQLFLIATPKAYILSTIYLLLFNYKCISLLIYFESTEFKLSRIYLFPFVRMFAWVFDGFGFEWVCIGWGLLIIFILGFVRVDIDVLFLGLCIKCLISFRTGGQNGGLQLVCRSSVEIVDLFMIIFC